MKKLLLLLFLLAIPAFSQTSNAVIRQFAGVPSGGCSFLQVALDAATGDFYDCFAGTWNLVTGGGGAGAPGGLNGQVQYNNGGNFGGITNLTSDGTNPILKAISAPSSPSSGLGILYEDSTSLNFAFKNATIS